MSTRAQVRNALLTREPVLTRLQPILAATVRSSISGLSLSSLLQESHVESVREHEKSQAPCGHTQARIWICILEIPRDPRDCNTFCDLYSRSVLDSQSNAVRNINLDSTAECGTLLTNALFLGPAASVNLTSSRICTLRCESPCCLIHRQHPSSSRGSSEHSNPCVYCPQLRRRHFLTAVVLDATQSLARSQTTYWPS